MENVIILNLDCMYEAMEADDQDKDYLSNIALAALSSMQSSKIPEETKSISESESYREQGNVAYKSGYFQLGMRNYNKALAYAPHNSLCLKLAYSNRSALLFTAKEYKACEQDCICALAIDCPTISSLTKKLELRKIQAVIALKQDQPAQHQDEKVFEKFADDYFKLKSQHADIPCASADVNIVIESGIPKVVAGRDIPAGTLVAFEEAFVSWAQEEDLYLSCYHCRKLDLNLHPCDGCVAAMFCSEECEHICMEEYHNDECSIAGSLFPVVPSRRWIIKAILKLKNMCTSLEEFITLAYDFGHKQSEKAGFTNDIFDGGKPSSMQSFYNDRHFVHGALHNYAFTCALALKVMQENMQMFWFPDGERRNLAVKAIARMFMYLGIYSTPITLALVATEAATGNISYHKYGHSGLFAFSGKLKHSCMPNLQILAVNNWIALVTSEQIKAGTELTVSFISHWLESYSTKNASKMQILSNLKTFCTCAICSSTHEERIKKTEISTNEKKAIKKCVTLLSCRTLGLPVHKCFTQLYKALDCMKNKKFSEDYFKLYTTLTDFQLFVIINKVKNTTISEKY